MNVAPLLRPCAEHITDKAPTAHRRGALWTQVLQTGFVTLLKNSVPPPVCWPPSDGKGSSEDTHHVLLNTASQTAPRAAAEQR